MVFLIILCGYILITLPGLLLINEEKRSSRLKIGLIMIINAICFIILLLATNAEAQKEAVDRNPYHKEYVYHVNPSDNTKVLVDSIYVKTKK